jgi:spermidine synthase
MYGIYFMERDPFSPIKYCYEIEEILCSVKTKYQDIKVLRSPYFGKMLLLDEVVQLTERDEHFYHEMLAHVALHSHPSPREILIVGGGDGGLLREVLKHQVVDKVLLVEIDREVIEVSKRFFPSLSTGFGDPRTQVIEMDGATFLSTTSERFDLIFVDCTDPVGIAESLFTEQFFRNAASTLKEEGMVVAQTESLHFHREFIREVQYRLSRLFTIVDLYTVPLATYAGNWWTFTIASKKYDPRVVTRKCEVTTRYYAEDVHHQAFLPLSLKNRLKEGTLG